MLTMAWVWKGRSGGAIGIPFSWGPTCTCTTSPSKFVAVDCCHCTNLEKLCNRESQALHKERHNDASPQCGDKLVQWVQRWNNKDNDWAQGGEESSIGATFTFLLTLMDGLWGGNKTSLNHLSKDNSQCNNGNSAIEMMETTQAKWWQRCQRNKETTPL